MSVCVPIIFRYETRKTGEGRAFVVTFKHTLNGVDEPSLYTPRKPPVVSPIVTAFPHQIIPSHAPLSCMCNDFNPDADSPRTFICITEMTEKGMCSKFDAAFDRCVRDYAIRYRTPCCILRALLRS